MNKAADHDCDPVVPFELVRDIERELGFSDCGGSTEVPQRAQDVWMLLLVPCDNIVSWNAWADTGSIVNCPPCMAASTERLESQFSEGATSRRRVGSLIKSEFGTTVTKANTHESSTERRAMKA